MSKLNLVMTRIESMRMKKQKRRKSPLTALIIIAAILFLPVLYSFYFITKVEKQWPRNGQSLGVLGVNANLVEIGKPIEGQSTLVMIHGASSNGREFLSSLVPRLNGHHILVPDRAGLGYSGRPEGAEKMAVQAEFIAKIMDAKGVKNAVIVGHSWGSAVSLRLAQDRPDLVKSIVLLTPATHPWKGGTSLVNKLAATPIIGKYISWVLPPIFGPFLMPRGIDEGFYPAKTIPEYRQKVGLDLVLRPETFRSNAMDLHAGTEELRAQSQNYSKIKVPISVIAGSGDKIVLNKIHTEGIKNATPQARIFYVDGQGHLVHWAKTDFVIEIIKAYSNGSKYPDDKAIAADGIRIER